MFLADQIIRKPMTYIMWLLAVVFSVSACVSVPTEADAAGVEAPSMDIAVSPMTPVEENLTSAEQQRWEATCGVTGGTVMRVDAVGDMHPGGQRISGYLIRRGTEKPISEELENKLVVLIRAKDGFDDSVLKRCKPGLSVGFQLKRSCSDTVVEQEISELVVDFGCNKLTIGGGTDRAAVQSYFFDPSRVAFVNLVKRALPDDEQLKSLKE